MKRLTAIAVLILGLSVPSFASTQGDLIHLGWYIQDENIESIGGDGYIKAKVNVVIYNTTSTARTITDDETGTVFAMTSTGDDACTFTLPDAEAGLIYTFIDNDATDTADLVVEPQSGDKIDNATAGNHVYIDTNDYGQMVKLLGLDDDEWIILDSIGTISTE